MEMFLQTSEGKARMLLLNLCLNSIIFATATTQIFDDNITESDYRLLDIVIPQQYDIHLIFPIYDINGQDVFGVCNITVHVQQSTPNIKLHSRYLRINKKAFLRDKIYDQNNILVFDRIRHTIEHTYNPKTHILNLRFNEIILPGFYQLHLSYNISESYIKQQTAYLNSSFPIKDPKYGLKKKMVVATIFRSIEARQMFPCFDEPRFKTLFNISINHENSYVVLSSVPTIRRLKDPKETRETWLWTPIHITSPRSTRHVTFLITNAIKIFYSKLSMHMWSRPNVVDNTEFALRVIETFLDETWDSGIPRYFTKVHHIVIPDMERNVIGKLGLTIYKEIFFTFDEKIDPVEHKMEVAHTVIHGMLDQWLDYKSCLTWWSEQWFTEGFQTLLRWEIVNERYSKWQALNLFVVQVHHECLHMDTDFHMKPVMTKVRLPSEIESVFSIELFIKAPVLLRMLQHIMTADKFREAIRNYLQMCEDSPMPLDYLWSQYAMETCISYRHMIYHRNYTVREVMENWAKQSNYPIVEVIRPNEDIIVFKLYHYYLNGYNMTYNVYNACVPITYTTRNDIDFDNTEPQYWLITEYMENITLRINEYYWTIVNLQQTGYYRVKYDYKTLLVIGRHLHSQNFTEIHVLNRAQIIDDICHFWLVNEIKYNSFRKFIYYFQREKDYIAWYPMFQFFRSISYFLPFEKSEILKFDIRSILHRLLYNIGYDKIFGEDDSTRSLRKEGAWWACTFGDSKCQEMASNMLNEHLLNPKINKLMPGWKEWAYCKGMMKANNGTSIKKYLLSTNTSVSKIYEYLSCSESVSIADDIILEFYMKAITNELNNTYIPYQLITKHARNNVDHIADNFKIYNNIVRNETKLLTIIIYHLYSTIQIDKIFVFINEGIRKRRIIVDRDDIINIKNRRIRSIKFHENPLIELIRNKD